MKKIAQCYNKLEEWLLVGSLAFSVILLFIQVIMRSVFNSSLSWSEELARYIFIWQIWLGTSIAFREDKHIKVELIYTFVKSEKGRAIVDILSNIILLAFSAVLCYVGTMLVISMFTRNALSAAMRIPLYFIYLSLPVSLFFLMLRILARVGNLCKKIFAMKREAVQ